MVFSSYNSLDVIDLKVRSGEMNILLMKIVLIQYIVLAVASFVCKDSTRGIYWIGATILTYAVIKM